MNEYFEERGIPQNIWVGVTVDISDSKDRIDSIRNLKAPIKFLSCEPLLEDLGALVPLATSS